MSDHPVPSDLPTSFGTFKPVGYVMLGLPGAAELAATVQALRGHPWALEKVSAFEPRNAVEELEALIAHASGLAGFGYEITLMRRYLQLARKGYHWLLVKVGDGEQAHQAAHLAAAQGATLAVHYKTLTVEDLI